MILESVVLSALFYGLLSAATLPLGAAIGVVWRPPNRVLAFLLAFGGGALLAALTIDLIAPGVGRGHFGDLAVGAIIGGLLFKLLDYLVNRQGGYLRKPSTAMNYWRIQARRRLAGVLGSMHRVQPLGRLSTEALDKLLSVMVVREVAAGTCLFRGNDPATNLYVIEQGAVELRDPRRGGRVIEQLGRNDVFGRMGFITGLHRVTEAHVVHDTKLLVVPRETFFELLADSAELRQIVAQAMRSARVRAYLRRSHGLSAEAASAWTDRALASLEQHGHYEPPLQEAENTADLIEVLRGEKRLGFFSGVSAETLNRIATRMVQETNPSGFNYFNVGQHAERLYLLCQGTVYLADPTGPSRNPVVVEAGDSFGALSFLTEGIHAVTAVGHGETKVASLRHRDFEQLLDEIPELRSHLVDYLRRNRIAEYLIRQQKLDAKKAAGWVEMAAKSVEGGKIFPSLAEMTSEVAGHKGAAMAVFLGILLDGIPESLVIGANVLVHGGISMSLVGGLFLANLPEALSSAVGMKDQGMKVSKIIAMWSSLMIMTGAGAALGAVVLEGAPDTLFALIEGIAAGAMLTVVAETMLPEAFHNGSGIVGMSTLAGFLTAVFFNTLG
jgi:CRP-like cAMP-binding protein